MTKYFIRLDDASERMNINNWIRFEKLLDGYNIKPLVGVIPFCQDTMMDSYPFDEDFWSKVQRWEEKGWIIALHGFDHVYITKDGGINPVNNRSEFAGVDISVQKSKIRNGLNIFRSHNIDAKVFFAPSHTFDKNTLKALKDESDIRFISDTVAFNSYKRFGFTFIPQQCGHARKIHFRIVTFCYHPNSMNNSDFESLELFLKNNKISSYELKETDRKYSLLDWLLSKIYFLSRKIRFSRRNKGAR